MSRSRKKEFGGYINHATQIAALWLQNDKRQAANLLELGRKILAQLRKSMEGGDGASAMVIAAKPADLRRRLLELLAKELAAGALNQTSPPNQGAVDYLSDFPSFLTKLVQDAMTHVDWQAAVSPFIQELLPHDPVEWEQFEREIGEQDG